MASSSTIGASQPTTDVQAVQGVVYAGGTAVGGARLTVYAVAAPQQAPRVLGQGSTNSNGTFALDVSCAAGSNGSEPIYIVVTEGEAQSTGPSNSAVRMVSVYPDCATLPLKLTVNELTTVAAAYTLNAFIKDETIAGNGPGLTNAIATVASLVDPTKGTLATSLPGAACASAESSTENCDTVEKINTLANALTACATSASSESTECTTLFECAASDGGATGSSSCIASTGNDTPSDTWQAITSIARRPGLASSTGIYNLAKARTTYTPVLATAPTDWSLALTFTGGGLSEPTALAIDVAGNIWVASYNSAVSKFSPTGGALSPALGFTGGGLEESFGIAIDAAGNVWICNEQSPGLVNAGRGSVTELSSEGNALSPSSGFTAGGVNFPQSLMVDAAGHIWVANYANATLTELAADGTALSPASGYSGGGMSFPVGVAVDASGNIWIANQGANQISEFGPTGVALSPASGYAGGGLDAPQSIAIDQRGDIWISNYYGNSLSAFSARGLALSPGTGYVEASVDAPGGIAIDGAGQIWAASFHGASITELAGSAAAQPGYSPTPNGLRSPELQQPFAVAIDSSGNLWVTNFGNDSLTEFIGLAAPVATPLIGIPRTP